jgi:putative component of toxin-antitoxin plasmid stabilization module
VLATIDIKDVFNSWRKIMREAEAKKLRQQLRTLFCDYLSDIKVVVRSIDEQMTREAYAVVSQGSEIGK